MRQYIALVHKEPQSDYGVMFPDFPGCITAGSTPNEALKLAKQALEFHVEGMRQDKIVLPKPRSVDEIKSANEDWVDFDNVFMVLSVTI